MSDATGVKSQSTVLAKTAECVFVTTHFHMGIGRLRQVRDIEVTTTADKSLLRHQKQLIDSPELDEIRSQDGYMTRHLASLSSYYSESTRFVQKTEAEKLWKAMEAYRSIRRPKLVADFMKKYRELEAVNFEPLSRPSPEGLGDQFDRGDYPKSDVVERGFYFEFELRPVGHVALDGLPSFIIDAEVAKERQQREAAVEEWKDTLRLAGQKLVDTLFDVVRQQPDGKKRIFRDSTIENLQEFLKTFSIRDLAGDSEYAKSVIEPLQKLMKGVTPEKIRESESLKAHIAAQVAEIKKHSDVLIQVTGRKFR